MIAVRDSPDRAQDEAPGPAPPGGPPAASGIEEVLATLYPWARRVAVLLCRDGHEAEDLVQDAFVQALRRPPEPPVPDAVRAWLRVVILRLWLRRRRSALREARALMRLHRERAEPPAGGSDEVLRALNLLSPRQRACVVLRYLEDLPEEEVARLLALRHGTVKAHLAQGRERLRRLLVDEA